MSIKTCASCEHVKITPGRQEGRVVTPDVYNCRYEFTDLVTGRKYTTETSPEGSCHDMRKRDGLCGPEGRLWEDRAKVKDAPEA